MIANYPKQLFDPFFCVCVQCKFPQNALVLEDRADFVLFHAYSEDMNFGFPDFQGEDISYPLYMNQLLASFPITATHEAEKTKTKIFPELANALRIKPIFFSRLLPTFIFLG